MRILTEHDPNPSRTITEHVACPLSRPPDRAFIRLNMISSADGGSEVAGLSGGLGNRDDHAVFAALREQADAVLVGMTTVVSEHYHAPTAPDLEIFVIAENTDVSGDPDLFASGRATLVIAEDAGQVPEGVLALRAGTDGEVDLRKVSALLAGKVIVMEGGPTTAGAMVSLGLVDEFFLTIAPRVIGGASARVVHGLDADPKPWELLHGFVDEQGFLFLRYARLSDSARKLTT
jgi:riboflavin biosynthesis pyrimidine reductase